MSASVRDRHPGPAGALVDARRRLERQIARSTNVWIFAVLVALVVIFGIFSPHQEFLSISNFRALGVNTSEVLLLAAGETYIMIAGGIDLSCGSFVVFSAVICAELVANLSASSAQSANLVYPRLLLGISAGVVGALLAGSAWGWFNGYVSVRWHVPPFIVTLGTLGMALGSAQLITGGLDVPNVPAPFQASFGIGGVFGVPWMVIVAAVVVAVLWALLHGTRFGLRTYAIGSNVEAARRAGVNVGRHQITLYALMGLITGIVGVLDVARFDTASIAAHTNDNLQAIAAAAIGGVSLYGGKGRMSGTVIGAFIPTVLANGFILLGFQPFWQEVAVGAVLIVAVYIDQVRRRKSGRSGTDDGSDAQAILSEERNEVGDGVRT